MITNMVILDHNATASAMPTEHLYLPNTPYSASELSAMAYHGLLRPQFGPYYVESGQPDTPVQRAKSVKLVGDHLVDDQWTATLLTAAWIHLGGPAPEFFEAATAAVSRPKQRGQLMPHVLRHTNYLERNDVCDDDLLVVGGVIVTSVPATIEDLLRIGGTRRHQHKAQALLEFIDVDTLQRRFRQRADLAGMMAAQQLLEGILSGEQRSQERA